MIFETNILYTLVGSYVLGFNVMFSRQEDVAVFVCFEFDPPPLGRAEQARRRQKQRQHGGWKVGC